MTDRYQPLRDAIAARSWPVGDSFQRNMKLVAELLKERDALRGLVSAITDNRDKCFIPTLGTDTPDALLGWDERARAALAAGADA